MSDHEKDNKDFEFIKEQVIEKKRKKIKKLLFPMFTSVGCAVLFGATAAISFAILEPNFAKILHKQEETVTPVCFPTECPQENKNQPSPEVTAAISEPTPTPVIVEQSIEADIHDYLSMNSDIRGVALRANMSIVNISSIFSVQDWFGKSVDKVVESTGVIVYKDTRNMLILVNLDKVKNAKNISLKLGDNIPVKAVLQDYMKELNLAMISVPVAEISSVYTPNLQPATLGESFTVTLGTPIIALGSPNGNLNSMEFGYVTSKGSSVGITDNRLDLFNTSIEDNENSNGIIINLDGKIIGMITSVLKEDNNKNINTVIGISDLKAIIEMMANKAQHIYFGIKADDMTTTARSDYNITNGIYVSEVQSDSPAFEAGIQKGDIILKLDNHDVTNTADFNGTISDYKPEAKLEVTVLRSSGTETNQIKLKVTLSEKDG